MVLVVIEASDVVFAVDSIPAVFGVTRDVFIVYTSNIFAIFGLRALCFLVASLVRRLHYLKPGIALVLAFVGVKMVLADKVPISDGLSLAVVGGIIFVAAIGSSFRAPRTPRAAERTSWPAGDQLSHPFREAARGRRRPRTCRTRRASGS